MPELPEIQAMVERLEAAVGGYELAAAQPLQFTGLKTVVPAPEDLVGRTLTGIGRRGKYALMEFGGPRIAFHLSQGGRVDIEDPPKATRPKFGVVRFVFLRANQGGPSLLLKEFGTERKAGWWVLAEGDDGPLVKLGPDADTPAFEEFIRTSPDNRKVHTILRDQRTVAGIGRGYSDDILHAARLSPSAQLAKLSSEQREALIAATREQLACGLELERKRTGGLPTKIGDHWRLHGNYGHPCPDCGGDLRRVSYESHEITYCPDCQTGGKVLADRRMSRLVR